MGDTSIPCTDPTATRLKQLRGDHYKNWDTFLNELADAWEERFDGEGVDADGLSKETREQLDRIESAASTAEERTGQIQGTLEELGGR